MSFTFFMILLALVTGVIFVADSMAYRRGYKDALKDMGED